ncbi:MAG: phosphoesterase PA-phosphatase [Actinomycetota bacterium]|nr:phosphoesterase PA-phosphatase [Actinomycetota bacterium]
MSAQQEVQRIAARPGRNKQRLARLVTEVLAPAPTVAGLLLVVAWRSTPTAAEAVKWGLLASLFASVIPFLFILRGVMRRRLTDHHVRLREQRPIPLIVGAASVLIGLGLLAWAGAPREIVALVAAMLVGLVTSTLVTLFWKLSIHTAVTAGALVILVLVFGRAFLVMTPVVGLVGWARVASGDHDLGQVLAGAALGTTVAGVVFSLLR